MGGRIIVPLAIAAGMWGSAALAGDEGYRLAGYVDIHAGLGAGLYVEVVDLYDYTIRDEERWAFFGGAGRAALWIDPFVFQIDAWLNAYAVELEHCVEGEQNQCDDFFGTEAIGGIAKHVGFKLDGSGVTLAAMGSIGFVDDWGIFATAAAEGVANIGDLRLLGQLGLTKAVFGYAFEEEDVHGGYAQIAATYYLNPDLSISGNAGASVVHDSYDTQTQLTFGGRVEHKLSTLPVAAYVAAQGYLWEGDREDVTSRQGQDYEVLVGLRFVGGGNTLQASDALTPFIDLNALYGDYAH